MSDPTFRCKREWQWHPAGLDPVYSPWAVGLDLLLPFWSQNDEDEVNLIDGQALTLQSGASRDVGCFGISAYRSTNGPMFVSPVAYQPTLTASQNMTIVIVARIDASATPGSLFWQAGAAGAAPRFGILVNSDKNGASSSGRVSFVVDDGSTVWGVERSARIDGDWHSFTMRLRQGNLATTVDGSYSQATSVGSADDVGQYLHIGGTGVGGTGVSGEIGLIATWTRPINDNEQSTIERNWIGLLARTPRDTVQRRMLGAPLQVRAAPVVATRSARSAVATPGERTSGAPAAAARMARAITPGAKTVATTAAAARVARAVVTPAARVSSVPAFGGGARTGTAPGLRVASGLVIARGPRSATAPGLRVASGLVIARGPRSATAPGLRVASGVSVGGGPRRKGIAPGSKEGVAVAAGTALTSNPLAGGPGVKMVEAPVLGSGPVPVATPGDGVMTVAGLVVAGTASRPVIDGGRSMTLSSSGRSARGALAPGLKVGLSTVEARVSPWGLTYGQSFRLAVGIAAGRVAGATPGVKLGRAAAVARVVPQGATFGGKAVSLAALAGLEDGVIVAGGGRSTAGDVWGRSGEQLAMVWGARGAQGAASGVIPPAGAGEGRRGALARTAGGQRMGAAMVGTATHADGISVGSGRMVATTVGGPERAATVITSVQRSVVIAGGEADGRSGAAVGSLRLVGDTSGRDRPIPNPTQVRAGRWSTRVDLKATFSAQVDLTGAYIERMSLKGLM